MKSSDDLFSLVTSLTSAEKRYFKVFSSMHVIGERNNYVRLFDAINKMEEYDEDSLREQFRGEKFVEHLSSEKVHLSRLILRSLRAYRDGNTIARQLATQIEEAEILTEKHLFSQAVKILRKVEKTAWEYEEFPILLRLLNLSRLHIHDMQSTQAQERIREVVEKTDDVLRRLHNQMEFQNLYDLVFALARRNLTDSDQAAAADIFANPLLEHEDRALSFEARLRFNSILAIRCQMQGDYDGNFACRKRIIELWKEHSHRLKEEPLRFIRASSNFVNSCIHLKRYEELPAVIASLRSLGSAVPHAELEPGQNIYYLELLYSLNTGQLERGVALAPEIARWLDIHANKTNRARLLALYYNLAVIHFLAERYEQALDWLYRIFNDTKTDSRQDIQCFIRLLLPVVHFELEHYDLLESRYRAAHYYLTQRQKCGAVEKAVLDFLKRLPSHSSDVEFVHSCSDLRDTLQQLTASDPQTARTLGIQELSYWLESKISGRPMAEMVR